MVKWYKRGACLLGILMLAGCVACGDTDVFKDVLTEKGVEKAPIIKIHKEVIK